MIPLALTLALGALPQISGTPQDDVTGRAWSLGVQLGPLDVPQGHLGIPIVQGSTFWEPAGAIVGRYQLGPNAAVNVGAGLPSSAAGLSAWGGFELLARLWQDRRDIVAIELYEDSGLQLGFAGPEYYARHDDSWVGTDYLYGGPVAFSVRLPVGVRFCWFHNRVDTSVEGAEMLALTPSVESLFDLSVAVRVHW